MGFTKLSSGIVDSSIWDEHSDVLKVFVAFWTKSSPEGIVSATENAIFRSSNLVDIDKSPRDYSYFKKVLNVLMSPDKTSKSKEHDGRRIVLIEESKWLIVNYKSYRDFTYSDNPEAKRKREYRKQKRDTSQSVSGHSVSVSVSESESVSEYTDEFSSFWKLYPRKIGKGAAFRSWKKIKSPVETLKLITTALEWQKKSDQWTKSNGQFIPHPATYLNQRRWEDEKGSEKLSDPERRSSMYDRMPTYQEN